MDDIVPGLLEGMQNDFRSQYDASSKIKELEEKLSRGTATYIEANEYAAEVGGITKKTYESNLSSEVLPGGKCYYNIAERITTTTLHNQYELVADYIEQVQAGLNKKAGIGIKTQRADENTEGYHSLANYMSAADNYDDVAKSTAQSAERFARETVDNSVKKNAEFQSKAGLSPKIIRSGGSSCCEWCSGLTGKYNYPDVPKEVYARHNNCTCTVEYEPSKGNRQNVHTKSWRSVDESDRIEERKSTGTVTSDQAKKIEYRKSQLVSPVSGDNIGVSLRTKTPEQRVFEATLSEQLLDTRRTEKLYECIVANSAIFKSYTPESMKSLLESKGYDVKPLGRGNLKGITFENGGGYRINFGGNGILQYHPENRSHHGGAYWKIKSSRGEKRYRLDGTEI